MTNTKPVEKWLFLGVILILMMVAVGGSVRLTNSGLSIVHWSPISGVIPPMNELEWQQEFEQYKKIPEYSQEHKHFELSDFKKIFYWEYFHRLIARLIGFIFLIPFIYFWIKGYFKDRRLLVKVTLIFIFSSFQAWLGWFMVKSGFADRIDVSHYRLAIHLYIATLLASFVLWTALDLKYSKIKLIQNIKLKKWTFYVLCLVSFQLFYGAFTAGLNAGYYYSDYPKMGSEWFPTLALNSWKSDGIISLFEDPSMVHFIHRWFAIIVLTVVIIFYLKFHKKNIEKKSKFLLNSLLFLILTQVSLGIITVLTKINIFIAVTHQVIAILIFLVLISILFFNKQSNRIK